VWVTLPDGGSETGGNDWGLAPVPGSSFGELGARLVDQRADVGHHLIPRMRPVDNAGLHVDDEQRGPGPVL